MSGIVHNARQTLAQLSKALTDTLLPRSCAACGENLRINDHGLCALCWRGLHQAIGEPNYCPRCGATVGPFTLPKAGCNRCRDLRPKYERLARVGLYRGPLAHMIRELKFRRQTHSAKLLGELLTAAVQGIPNKAEFDLVSWVPLHWFRQYCRGYNQAELLAKRVAQLGSWPTRRALRRVRWTKPQTHLSKRDRLENVKGAFALSRPQDTLKNMKILLIDDVLTTGATASEAAGVLKNAGAEVVVAVIAVAGT